MGAALRAVVVQLYELSCGRCGGTYAIKNWSIAHHRLVDEWAESIAIDQRPGYSLPPRPEGL